ncbi:hypothetical protein V8E36_000138 [Tilletia maclaganii]
MLTRATSSTASAVGRTFHGACASSALNVCAGPSRIPAAAFHHASGRVNSQAPATATSASSSSESSSASPTPSPSSTPASTASEPTQIARSTLPARSAAAALPTLGGYTKDNLPTQTDPTLAFFVGILMRDGKKATANRAVMDVLGHLNEWTSAPPLPLFQEAIARASPLVRMQSSKTGGKITQIPIPLNPRQSAHRGIKGIIEASKKRNDRYLSTRLAREVLAVLEGSSSVLQRKEEQHKVAMANRANASVRI